MKYIELDLKYKVAEAMKTELKHEDKKGLLYHSNYEAYGYFLENQEEITAEMNNLKDITSDIWDCIKHNDAGGVENNVKAFDDVLFFIICELIQWQAMLRKWERGVEIEN